MEQALQTEHPHEKPLAHHRVSRKESQARTRDRLIGVARVHFLRDGLGGAKVEAIAEEAGYTRGAFYANFADKNDLFVAVLEATADAEMENLKAATRRSTGGNLAPMRDAFARLIANTDWVRLQSEFQATALRNEAIRREYTELLQRKMRDAAGMMTEPLEQAAARFGVEPFELMLIFSSFLHGFSARQAIAEPVSYERARELAALVFDRLVLGSTP